MPRIPRNLNQSGFFHIIVQGINKMFIFDNDNNKNFYMYLMKKYNQKFDIDIISYCIMDNHTHLLIHTIKMKEISGFMKCVNTNFAKFYNKKNKRVGYVFRDRFKSLCINNERYLYACIKYIHMNPVKAKIVNSEGEYKYSSYNDYIKKTNFINEKILKLVFNTDENYLARFAEFKEDGLNIEDIDENDMNFRIAIDSFLNINNIKIEDIKKDKYMLEIFCKEMLEKGYRKSQIADKLNINRRTLLYRMERWFNKE